MRKKILITGVTGFLCSRLALRFLDDGYEVWGLCRDKAKAEAIFGSYSLWRPIYQDVCERLKLNIRFDYIIHGASPASPQLYKRYPVDVIKPNTVGTLRMLEYAALLPPKRFMYISSAAVYGERLQEPCDEHISGVSNPLDIRSCYEESKRLGENLVTAFGHQYGVEGVVLRPYHVYGPGMGLGDGRVISDFLENIINGQEIVIRGDGRATRTLLYVDDFISGALTVMMKGRSQEAYNIGNPMVELSVRQMAETISELYGLEVKFNAPVKAGYLPSPIDRMPINVARIMGLGWRPEIDFTEGIQRTVKSLK